MNLGGSGAEASFSKAIDWRGNIVRSCSCFHQQPNIGLSGGFLVAIIFSILNDRQGRMYYENAMMFWSSFIWQKSEICGGRQPGNFWLCPVKPEMQFTKNFRKSSKLDERMINAQGQVGGQSVGRWKKKEVFVFDNNDKILWAVGCDDDVMMLTPNCKTMIIIITIIKRSYGLGGWKETNPSGPSFPLIHSSLRHSTFLQSFEEEKHCQTHNGQGT